MVITLTAKVMIIFYPSKYYMIKSKVLLVFYSKYVCISDFMRIFAHKKQKHIMKVSIIIPVYNKEEYIETCLRSVLTQDFDDFEVVAVNDGSSDRSGELCDAIAAEYPALKVIHTSNGGVTAARRKGVEASTGRYITFVDADDKMLPGGLRVLYESIVREDADEVVATYITQNGENISTGITGIADNVWMIKELLACRAKFCVLWAVIFRKELLDGCLNTPRIIRSGEDILMQILCLMKNPKVVFITDAVYSYTAGLPNDRSLILNEQVEYDQILSKALLPQWNVYKDAFTLRQLKMYENFISQKQFGVLREYYHKVRKQLNGNIPLADRIAIMLPPQLAYIPIIARKRWMK